jgi:hypothetical protein
VSKHFWVAVALSMTACTPYPYYSGQGPLQQPGRASLPLPPGANPAFGYGSAVDRYKKAGCSLNGMDTYDQCMKVKAGSDPRYNDY